MLKQDLQPESFIKPERGVPGHGRVVFMFYYYSPYFQTYNYLLVAAAIIPAVFLMIKVYRSDKLEPESPRILWALIRSGILASLIAMVAERVLEALLDASVRDDGLYRILLYFVVVAFSEEGAKYYLLRRNSWHSEEFNCRFDGVVYAVFVSLGFALWENLSYVLHYGLSTAIVRALTAIPGHACFGVFMGVFYSLAKQASAQANTSMARLYSILSLIVPALLHGTYDYIASSDGGTAAFIIFVAVLFTASYALIVKTGREDRAL